MNNVTTKKLFSALTDLGVDTKKLEDIYPNFTKPFISLAEAGISKRNYSHWKKEGLVSSSGSERAWVKLNLFEYVWLRIIQELRDFGISISSIKSVRQLLFTDVINSTKRLDKNKLLSVRNKLVGLNDQQFAAMVQLVDIKSDIEELIPQQDLIFRTFLSCLISSELFQAEEISVVLYKQNHDLIPAIYAPNSIFFNNGNAISNPHIRIPIRSIIEEFFSNPNAEKYAVSLGLINKYENRLLELFRNGECEIIRIHNNNPNNIREYIDVKDIKTRGVMAKELLSIFGRNNYTKVTAKLKNRKQIILKNKLELNSLRN